MTQRQNTVGGKDFIGVVVDDNDPLRMGRLKIRTLEMQTLTDDELPWMAVSGKGGDIGGIGTGPSGIKKGSTIHGTSFTDQTHTIAGSLPKAGNDTENGGFDNSKRNASLPVAARPDAGGGDFRLQRGTDEKGPVEYGQPGDGGEITDKSVIDFAKTEAKNPYGDTSVKHGNAENEWTGGTLRFPESGYA